MFGPQNGAFLSTGATETSAIHRLRGMRPHKLVFCGSGGGRRAGAAAAAPQSATAAAAEVDADTPLADVGYVW